MTGSAAFFQRHLGDARTMAILRGHSPEDTVALCRRAVDAGMGLIEVPVQTPDTYASFRAACKWGRDTGVPIGAGTVTSVALLERVRDWGGAFTVAPGLDDDVVSVSTDMELPHLPGVATASDIQRAYRHGLRWLKAFPASVLGPQWVAAMRAPFPNVRFVMTGGMTVAVARDHLDAGAAAVSLGASFAAAPPSEIRALRRP